jgi:hypothetical protein
MTIDKVERFIDYQIKIMNVLPMDSPYKQGMIEAFKLVKLFITRGDSNDLHSSVKG